MAPGATVLSAAAAALLLSASAASAAWPDCYETGVDYMGFDKKWVNAFSPDGCAKWCRETDGCARWVFKESGSKCHLKVSDDPADKRDKTDPLTADDKAEFPGDNVTAEKQASKDGASEK